MLRQKIILERHAQQITLLGFKKALTPPDIKSNYKILLVESHHGLTTGKVGAVLTRSIPAGLGSLIYRDTYNSERPCRDKELRLRDTSSTAVERL
jgi:hypothetical protein